MILNALLFLDVHKRPPPQFLKQAECLSGDARRESMHLQIELLPCLVDSSQVA